MHEKRSASTYVHIGPYETNNSAQGLVVPVLGTNRDQVMRNSKAFLKHLAGMQQVRGEGDLFCRPRERHVNVYTSTAIAAVIAAVKLYLEGNRVSMAQMLL